MAAENRMLPEGIVRRADALHSHAPDHSGTGWQMASSVDSPNQGKTSRKEVFFQNGLSPVGLASEQLQACQMCLF